MFFIGARSIIRASMEGTRDSGLGTLDSGLQTSDLTSDSCSPSPVTCHLESRCACPSACSIMCVQVQKSEVSHLAETQRNPLPELVREARECLTQELRAQAEQLQKLEQSLQELRQRHQQLEGAIEQQLEVLEKVELPSTPVPAAAGAEVSLEKLLGAVRNLITATLPEQVLGGLTEEAEQTGVRVAVFDVRGKAAWGSSACGFGDQLPERALRTLVVPLSQDNPFGQVYETGGHVDASVESLKKNRNILDKFKPDRNSPILLLPIRSAGSVSAILYADAGSTGRPLPVEALKILTEFAGAQLDRLMAFSGGMPSAEAAEEVVEAEPVAEPAPAEAPVEVEQPEPWEVPASQPVAAAAIESAPVVEEPPPPPPPLPAPPVVQAPAPPPAEPAAAGFDISQLSEAEQKVHKDAKRFAKLLISEIELYNKAKVADGRKNKDLYKRMKADIARSRQTFEKRFGKMAIKQFDYFHDELVRTLAGNDPSLLGADYPGPSV